MRSDSEIKNDGFKLLFNSMDKLEAERFITIIKQDNFDYTKWRQSLFEDMTVEEIHKKAVDFAGKFRKIKP
jgi:hypothetical protein